MHAIQSRRLGALTIVAAAVFAGAVCAQQPVTIDRAMNVVRVWNSPDVWANDFHVDLIARDLAGNYLDQADLDPFGYWDGIATNRVVSVDPVTHRISIEWSFPDRCITDPLDPEYVAQFGFTFFGGVRYEIVDWYWTRDGVRVQSYPDVWQDWVKNPLTLQLEDVIVPRPPPVLPPWPPRPPWPPNPPAATPAWITRTLSTAPALGPIAISDLAATVTPPNATTIGPQPVYVTTPPTTIDYGWAWPGVDPTYYMFYELADATMQPIAGFRNAALLAEEPLGGTSEPQAMPTDAFPPPTGVLANTSGVTTVFANGAWVRNFTVSSITSGSSLPTGAGEALIQSSSAAAQFDLSLDDGGTWLSVTATNGLTARAAVDTTVGPTTLFDTEMLQLAIGGGNLPANVRLRESPSYPSRGGLSLSPADGTYMIDSFFDVFLEVSTDGGQTWSPPVLPAPIRVNLERARQVTLNRSLNVVRLWTAPGVWVNDFHIDFIARDGADARFLDLDDVDPFGYWDGIATNRIVAFEAATNRISITWQFADICIPDPNSPVYFGFTLFGGVRYQAVDWYWTRDGERVTNFQDVWQDWVKNPFTLQLEDVIVPRPIPFPPPLPGPPTTVAFVSRTTGSQPAPVSIGTLVATAVPPSPVIPEPGPLPVVVDTPITYGWVWPGIDPTYYMYYDLLDASGTAIAGFQNAAILVPTPTGGGTPQAAASDAFPPPAGQYGTAAGVPVAFGGAVTARNIMIDDLAPGNDLPAAGDAAIRNVGATLALELNTGGGYSTVSTPARLSFRIADAGLEGDTRLFDTELLSLDTTGGTLPPTVLLREQAAPASLGRTTVRPVDGTYRIDSFFDVWLEISTDGGNNWTAPVSPARVTLTFPAPAATPVSVQRSLNVVRVWNQSGVLANDFHIEFVARDAAGVRWLDLTDVDPSGYWGPIATNRIVSYDAGTRRISITWQFPDTCVDPADPAFFGFTLFGGVRYDVVDWYWTYDGVPIARYQDVWQDWIKVDGNLRDVIVPRPVPEPPPPGPWPTSVVFVARTVGMQTAPVSIATLASMTLPPSPVVPDPGPVVVVPATPINANWAWPGADPTYFVFYDLQDAVGNTIAGFQNACIVAPPVSEGGPMPPEVLLMDDDFPPPESRFVGDATISFGTTFQLRAFDQRAMSPSTPLPDVGQAVFAAYDSVVTFDYSTDEGATWNPVVLDAEALARIVGTGIADPFDCELLQLPLAGGALPAGVLLRESPTEASVGRYGARAVAEGYMISSFFDVFLEVSFDGGVNWTPANQPLRVTLEADPHFTIRTVVADPNGSINVNPVERVAQGGLLTVVYTANQWYRIGELHTDGEPVVEAAGQIAYEQPFLDVQADHSNHVAFALATQEQTGLGVPSDWAGEYYATEAEARADADIEKDYLLNVDPTIAHAFALKVIEIAKRGTTVTVRVRLTDAGLPLETTLHGELVLFGASTAGGSYTRIGSTAIEGAQFDANGEATVPFNPAPAADFLYAVIEPSPW